MQKDSDSEDSDIQVGDTAKDNKKTPALQTEKVQPEQESDDGEDIKPIQSNRKAPTGPPVAGPPREREVQQTEPEEYIEIVIARPEDLNFTNMKNFITNPPPKGKMVQCTIMRDKGKLSKKFSPKYHVYLSVEAVLTREQSTTL